MIAKAAVNAYCPGSNSWRVLRAEDEVLLHVIDTSADADADNDGGCGGAWSFERAGLDSAA